MLGQQMGYEPAGSEIRCYSRCYSVVAGWLRMAPSSFGAHAAITLQWQYDGVMR